MYIIRIIKEINSEIIKLILTTTLKVIDFCLFRIIKSSIIKELKKGHNKFHMDTKDLKYELLNLNDIRDIGVKNLFEYYSKKISFYPLCIFVYPNKKYRLVNCYAETLLYGNYENDIFREVIRDMKELAIIKIVDCVVNNKKEKIKRISKKDIENFIISVEKQTKFLNTIKKI